MGNAAPRALGVRDHIAAETSATHEALHHSPILRQLTSPEVNGAEYIRAISVLAAFYLAVERERARLECWEGFGLRGECDALRRDLAGQMPSSGKLLFSNDLEVLGGLYVAHGAAFGRNLFRQNLSKALPEAPLFFVNQRVRKDTWRALVECLETCGQDPIHRQSLLVGAARSFEIVAETSDRLVAQGTAGRLS